MILSSLPSLCEAHRCQEKAGPLSRRSRVLNAFVPNPHDLGRGSRAMSFDLILSPCALARHKKTRLPAGSSDESHPPHRLSR